MSVNNAGINPTTGDTDTKKTVPATSVMKLKRAPIIAK